MNDTENPDTPTIRRSLEDVTFALRADHPSQPMPTSAGNRASRRDQAQKARTTKGDTNSAQQPSTRTRSRRSTRATSQAKTAAPTQAPQAAHSRTFPTEPHSTQLLKDMLGAFVPVHILEMRSVPHRALQEMAAEAAQIIASHGDDLMFSGKHCAATYTALSNGLAAAALLAPGGVNVMGLHFCAQPHPECPNAPLAPHLDRGEEERPPSPASEEGGRG